MKLTRRQVDILTAVCGVLTVLSVMPYELEKLPIPPDVKPWAALAGALATGALRILKTYLPPSPPSA